MLGFYRTYTTPFKESIPIMVENYLSKKPFYKRASRFIGRYLYTESVLRRSQKLDVITKEHKKILWIRTTTDCFGDSLSDLSSRILLKDKQIDLLTKKNTAVIYQNDDVFSQIFTSANDCNVDYDLMIIGNYRKRELKNIPKKLLSIPHVSLYGYFSVKDLNTLYFSFFRINQLLAQPYTEKYMYNNAKPLLTISNQDKQSIDYYNLSNNFIAISVGGMDVERTFNAWDRVIKIILLENPKQNIVLVGANNSNQMAEKILEKHSKNVQDLTNKLSFNQTAEIISRAEFLLCCDGGLMHVANAVQTPIVALFCYIAPELRLIKSNLYEALLNKEDVNNISVDKIVEKVKLLKDRANGK